MKMTRAKVKPLRPTKMRPTVTLSPKATVQMGGLPHPHKNLGKWLHKPK